MGKLQSWIDHLKRNIGGLETGRDGVLELLAMLEELAELRRLRDRPLTMFGIWAHGGDDPVPSRVCLTDDGDGVDHQIDVTPLLDEVLRRQARKWCRSVADGEGPALEQLLALVPVKYALRVDEGDQRPYEAGWEEWDEIVTATGPTREAAIRAATCELLGVDVPAGDRQLSGSPARLIRAAMVLVDDWAAETHEGLAGNRVGTAAEAELEAAVNELRGTAVEPRQTCGSCQHWWRNAEPATEAGARPCRLDEEPDPTPRHPASLCARPDYYRALEQADTDPAPDEYPSSDEALAAKIAKVRAAVAEGGSVYPDATRTYLGELLAEQRRRQEQLPGVTVDGNLVRSEGDS